MSNDTELLRQYLEGHTESAFSELVHRHLNLVYSAGLRETGGDTALAEDLSQAVFTELARKAPRLLDHPSLAGWLYTAVRHTAANLRRSEQHRRKREEEAQIMNELLSEDSPAESWEQLRPVIDSALHGLKESDRTAIVLRFLENRSLRDVGAEIGLTENAARMRVDRALERLRGELARRGVTSTASGLAATLVAGMCIQAPAALGASITTAALASSVAVSSNTLFLIKFMTFIKTKLAVAGLVVAGLSVPLWQQTRINQARSENDSLRAKLETPAAIQSPKPESTPIAQTEELQQLREWKAKTEPELLRLRGMAGLARSANAENEELRKKLAQKEKEFANPIGTAMADAMEETMKTQAEGKLARITASLHLTPEQVTAAREILMRQAKVMAKGMQQGMTGKINKDELEKMAKEAGNPDTQIQELLTADQKANYPAYQKEENAHTASAAANSELVQLQNSLDLAPEQLDPVFAALYQTSLDQIDGKVKPEGKSRTEIIQWTLDQKAKALEPLLTAPQLEKFRRQQEMQSKLVKDMLGKMNVK
jgi:RNA polymerase sigma factor (sigma-70 family)